MRVLGPTFGVSIIHMREDRDWVEVELRKSWFVVGPGGQSTVVARTYFNRKGMGEREVLEASLLELLRALADRLA